VAAEARVFLAENGVDLTAAQQTKTKTALNYFAGQLRKAADETEPASAATTTEEAATEPTEE
jgi:hypothetical protein